MNLLRLSFPVAAVLVPTLPTASAVAHGFAGDRFFPATIQTDDPFVADEASLPTLTRNPTDGSGTQSYSVDVDLAKRITRDTDLTFHYAWDYLQPKGQSPVFGFSGLQTGQQYQLFIDGPREAMALIGLQESWAHTGRVQAVGAPDFTTLTPTFAFGKGFGDLPDSVPWLRPLAITGNLSVDFPTKTQSNGNPNPNNFNAGFAIEYSLEYLQHHVRDIGLGKPFDRLIPLVEFTSTTTLNRGVGGITTGVIAPGFIWAGQYYQLASEIIIPYGNSAQGHGIGALLQLHFFIDDLFPRSIGKPLFD